MKYTVHAGHAPAGRIGCGAVGFCHESTVARAIKDAVIFWLKFEGHLAVDCTYESGGTQSYILSQIKKKINAEQNVTANISIHLNAATKRKKDGKITGSECWVYTGDKASTTVSNRILANLKKLGFTNRSVKSTTKLAILKGIKNGGNNILVECFFCDDEDDFLLYSKLGSQAVGKAIAEGIVGHTIGGSVNSDAAKYVYTDKEFGKLDLSPVFNPNYYALHNKDVADACKNNAAKMFEHFYTYGMNEGRQASADFNVRVYKERYLDLQQVYGNNLMKYYLHYCKFGFAEGRKGI